MVVRGAGGCQKMWLSSFNFCDNSLNVFFTSFPVFNQCLTKSSTIIKTVYGESSVEYAYELRKMGEMSLSLGDIRASLDATRRSKDILETCYSPQHRDVIDLDETVKQLEIVERSSYFQS